MTTRDAYKEMTRDELLELVETLEAKLRAHTSEQWTADSKAGPEANSRYQVLFTQFAVDSLSDGAFWMGADRRPIYVNDAACESLGYTREELLGMELQEFAPNATEEM